MTPSRNCLQLGGKSPFAIVYSFTPRISFDLLQIPSLNVKSLATNNFANQVNDTNAKAQATLAELYAKHKAAAGKHKRDIIFKEGYLVFLRKERFPTGTYNKLAQEIWSVKDFE